VQIVKLFQADADAGANIIESPMQLVKRVFSTEEH
jgi:hypothetical protein